MRDRSIEDTARSEWEPPQLVDLSKPSKTGGGPFYAPTETSEVAPQASIS